MRADGREKADVEGSHQMRAPSQLRVVGQQYIAVGNALLAAVPVLDLVNRTMSQQNTTPVVVSNAYT